MVFILKFQDVGYHHGQSYFNGMMKGGKKVEHIYKLKHEDATDTKSVNLSLHSCPANFTDLAQIVCKVKNPEGVPAAYGKFFYRNDAVLLWF